MLWILDTIYLVIPVTPPFINSHISQINSKIGGGRLKQNLIQLERGRQTVGKGVAPNKHAMR